LEDVIRRLGTEEFSGCGSASGNAESWNWADFVLSKFSREELS